MEKFNRTLRGYDPEEVNKFLDQVIVQVEKMVADIQEKDRIIMLICSCHLIYLLGPSHNTPSILRQVCTLWSFSTELKDPT